MVVGSISRNSFANSRSRFESSPGEEGSAVKDLSLHVCSVMKRIARHRPRKSTFSQTLCHFVPFVAFIKLNSKIHHNTDRSLDYIVIIERYSLSHSSSSIVTCAYVYAHRREHGLGIAKGRHDKE